MSNTTKRILSALCMVAIVCVCFYMGSLWCFALFSVAALLVFDELTVNFLDKKRGSLFYLIALLITVGSILVSFKENRILELSYYPAILTCSILTVWLFITNPNQEMTDGYKKFFSVFMPLMNIVLFLSVLSLFYRDSWRILVGTLFVINFGMDTGAWFFGKNFGKRKLWEAVSPNKTIEGLLGGILTSAVIGAVFLNFFTPALSLENFVAFGFLGMISQVGDLIQSRIKRLFSIKDSSNLIPGHGGVYDRLDSLIFMTPFYVALHNILNWA